MTDSAPQHTTLPKVRRAETYRLDEHMSNEAYRVVVVGAGPAGIQSAQALAAARIEVDVIDTLPTPYGLVRYGVAPDHQNMKSCMKVLQRVFSEGAAGFIGNVELGRDLSLTDLLEHYHAVVLSMGSPLDRALGVPGENLAGSLGSREVASWYSGHPDLHGWAPPLDAPSAVVVGAGNVALDVTRVLAQPAACLRDTDVPEDVLQSLEASQLRDLHLLIRRGPTQTRFSPAELEELGALRDVDVVVHDDGELELINEAQLERVQAQNLQTLRKWSRNSATLAPRRIHLHFFRRPVRIHGDSRVTAVMVERTALIDGRLANTGHIEAIDAGLVIRAIGYDANPIAGLPFAAETGTLPNDRGRVLVPTGELSRVYVAGWLKRGPNGRIGTNRSDAQETVTALLEDLPGLPHPSRPRTNLRALLHDRGVEFVDYPGWLAIDALERRLGADRGTARVKTGRRSRMLKAAANSGVQDSPKVEGAS